MVTVIVHKGIQSCEIIVGIGVSYGWVGVNLQLCKTTCHCS